MTNLGFSASDNTFQARFSQADQSLRQIQQDYSHPGDRDHEKLKKSAQEFEAIFFKQVIEQMDKTVERGEFLTGGAGEEMFRTMLFDEVSMRASNRPGGTGLGLAEEIYRQMSKTMTNESGNEQQILAPKLTMPAAKELKMGQADNQLKTGQTKNEVR